MTLHIYQKSYRRRRQSTRPSCRDPQGPPDKPDRTLRNYRIQKIKIDLAHAKNALENIMINTTLSTKLRSTSAIKIFLAAPIIFGMTLPALAAIENTAQVSGSTPDGGTVTDSSTETITLQTATPVFTVVKSVASLGVSNGADSVNPDGGDSITYSYLVDNTGNVSIDGTTVSITDPGPTFNGTAGTNTLSTITYQSGDSNLDNQIGINETWLYQATYPLAQIDVDRAAGITDGVSNTITTASATGIDSFGAATFDTANSTLTVTETIIENGSLALSKIATRDGTTEDDGSATAYNTGDTVTYRLTILNDGNVTINTMTVSETAFTGTGGVGAISAISCATSTDATIATLAPGASEVCTATYVIQESDL